MFKTILVPLDGSEGAEAAVAPAAAIAEKFGARVVVLEVAPGYRLAVGAMIAEAFGAAGSVDAAVESEEAREELAKAYLEALRASEGKPDWEMEVREGDPGDVITARAEALDADLIVMATQHHSRIRNLLGSTSEEIIRRTRRPVLVVDGDVDA